MLHQIRVVPVGSRNRYTLNPDCHCLTLQSGFFIAFTPDHYIYIVSFRSDQYHLCVTAVLAAIAYIILPADGDR
jgi:hypothetical protein